MTYLERQMGGLQTVQNHRHRDWYQSQSACHILGEVTNGPKNTGAICLKWTRWRIIYLPNNQTIRRGRFTVRPLLSTHQGYTGGRLHFTPVCLNTIKKNNNNFKTTIIALSWRESVKNLKWICTLNNHKPAIANLFFWAKKSQAERMFFPIAALSALNNTSQTHFYIRLIKMNCYFISLGSLSAASSSVSWLLLDWVIVFGCALHTQLVDSHGIIFQSIQTQWWRCEKFTFQRLKKKKKKMLI